MIEFIAHTAPVLSLAFSADSYSLASLARNGEALLFDPTGFSQPITDPVAGGQWIGFLPNGWPAIGDTHGLAAYREGTARLGGRLKAVSSCAIVDATTLAVGIGQRHKAEPGEFLLLDLGKNTIRTPRISEAAGVRSVAVHCPSRTVAWANGSRQVMVWDIMKPDRRQFNLTHSSPSVAIHPDGKWFAAALDYAIHAYDIATRHERGAFRGHKGLVTAIAFSPDGQILASGSWDETVRLWESDTGQEIGTYRWPTGKVYALAFSPDGTRLAAAGQTGRIVVWDRD